MIVKKIDNKLSLSIFLLIFGVFIAYLRGSNFSDGDSYSVINAFLSLLNEESIRSFKRSIWSSYTRILIGFIAYNFGTRFSNIFCFILFFSFNNFFIQSIFKNKDKCKFIYYTCII